MPIYKRIMIGTSTGTVEEKDKHDYMESFCTLEIILSVEIRLSHEIFNTPLK